MKKVLFLSLITCTLVLSSCGGHKTEEVTTSTTDSTMVSVDTMSVVKDTIAK